jgi:hypothetical protein
MKNKEQFEPVNLIEISDEDPIPIDIWGDDPFEGTESEGVSGGIVGRIRGLLDSFRREETEELSVDLSSGNDFDEFDPESLRPQEPDIFGDPLVDEVLNTEHRPGLLDRIRSRRKIVGAVLVLSGLVGAGAKGYDALSEAPEKPAQNPIEQVQESSEESEGDKANEEREESAEVDHSFAEKYLFESSQLNEVLDVPFTKTAEQIADSADPSYDALRDLESKGMLPNSEFLGAYESISGLKFNVFTINREGPNTMEYEMNPESLEFIIAMIKDQLPNAPDNPNKDSILHELERVQSGEFERILDFVVDVTRGEDCLDANFQLVKAVEGICSAGGVTYKTTNTVLGFPIVDQSATELPIIISADSGYNDTEIKELPNEDGTVDAEVRDYDVPLPVGSNSVIQLHQGAHEAVHALDETSSHIDPEIRETEIKNSNIYKEGDGSHELTSWLFGSSAPEGSEFDYEGQDEGSPRMVDEIRKLVNQGKLKPIVQVRGSGSSGYKVIETLENVIPRSES